MRTSLLAVFVLLTLFLPNATLGITDTAITGEEEYHSTCGSSYSCLCDDRPTYINATDAASCETVCQTIGATTYALTCTSISGNNTLEVGDGDVNFTVEETSEIKRDPVVPNLIVDIPGLTFTVPTVVGGKVLVSFLGEYINAVYRWLIPAMTLVAIVMLMIAGLQYTLSRGNVEIVKKAKTRMSNAVVGLILLLLAYNIAFVINPNTVRFSSLAIDSIPIVPVENFIEPENAVDADPEGNYYGQSGWQDCMLNTYGATKSEVESQLVTVPCAGKNIRVHKLIQENFSQVCEALEGANYTINTFGGFSWRANRNNAKALSFHSWGVAFDLNEYTNPNCGDSGFICSYSANSPTQSGCSSSCSYDIPPSVVQAFNDNGFRWGGDWRTVKDYMHFSFNTCGGGR